MIAPTAPIAAVSRRLTVAVVILAITVHAIIATRSVDYLVDKIFLHDDTFYPLTVARNIAAGHGSTLDGIHSTNAYQPLLTFLAVPLYRLWPDNDDAPLRAILVLLAAANLLNGYWIARIAMRVTGDRRFGLLGFAIWTLSLPILQWVVNGLETALSLCLVLALATTYLERRLRGGPLDARAMFRFGLLGGLAILARIDAAFLLAAIGIDVLRRPLPDATPIRKRLAACAAFTIGAAILSSPWFIWNAIAFGELIPKAVAGYRVLVPIAYGADPNAIPLWFYGFTGWQAVKLLVFASPLLEFLRILGVPHVQRWELPLTMLAITALALVIRAAWRRASPATQSRLRALLPVAGSYAAMLILGYTLYVLATFFYARYFTPILALLIAVGTALFGPLVLAPRVRRITISIGIVALGTMAIPYLTPSIHLGIPLQTIAREIREVTPPDARIGAFQAGMLSYFSDRTVVNLDGKLNTSVLPALRSGRLDEYLARERITYVGDTPSVLSHSFWPRLGPLDPPAAWTRVITRNDYELYRRTTSRIP